MSSPQTTNPNSFGISGDDLSALVGRITSSPHFQRSKRLQAFLRYVCDQTAAQRLDEISEIHIGQKVFDRGPEFNPSEDNIVRVEARELRKRLDLYFSQEGAGEPVLIEIPRGSYVPSFVSRPLDSPHSRPQDPIAPPAPIPLPASSGWVWKAACAILACLSGWLWVQAQQAESAARPPENVRLFWDRVLSPARPTLVAAADSSFALLQDLRRENVSFEDYINGSFFSSLRGRTATEIERYQAVIASRAHTSLADATLYARISRLAPPGATVNLRFARELRAQDMQANNIVFLGSERANPWASLFSSWRNFEFRYDTENDRASLLNKRPRQGEPAEFTAARLGRAAAESYAAIAFLPNLDRSGHVVILAGTSMQGSAAAGDFLTSPGKLEELAKALGAAPGRPLPYFEAVLKLVAVDVSSVSTQIVAHRIIDASRLESIRYTHP